MTIEVIRHTADPLISIYSGPDHIGLVFPPINGRSAQWEASPNNLNRAMFDSEDAAIAHVIANA